MKNLKSIHEFFNQDNEGNTKYNGIIFCSSKENRSEYYLLFILDESDDYLECLDMNSISCIRDIQFDISDEFENISNIVVPLTDTFLIEELYNFCGEDGFNFTSYGFMVADKEISDEDINKTIKCVNSNKRHNGEYYNRSYKVVKCMKVKYINGSLNKIKDLKVI